MTAVYEPCLLLSGPGAACSVCATPPVDVSMLDFFSADAVGQYDWEERSVGIHEQDLCRKLSVYYFQNSILSFRPQLSTNASVSNISSVLFVIFLYKQSPCCQAQFARQQMWLKTNMYCMFFCLHACLAIRKKKTNALKNHNLLQKNTHLSSLFSSHSSAAQKSYGTKFRFLVLGA